MEEIDLKPPEETTLFTDEEHVTVNSIDFEFEQANKVRGIYRKMTVFNGNHCYQSIEDKHQRRFKYRVDISYLNPRPYRQRYIAWKWCYLSAFTALMTAVMIVGGWFTDVLGSSPGMYHSAAVIAAASATLISLLLFAHSSYDKVVFKTKFGNIQLIELLNRYPNKSEFRQFVSKFMLQIKKAQTEKKFTTTQFLTKELKELRRLRDETVITEHEYQRAKKIIFRHNSFKAA
ncbi:MAG: SHOCT domain-containing protein [Gammaproteobacteria bacterium]|nr:SHOCT domain-containing protein [Gammaproteobacteria bacterium]